MKIEELTEKLQHDSPAEWPGFLKELDFEYNSMPEDIRVSVQKKIDETCLKQSKKMQRGITRWHIAAAAVIPAAFALTLFLVLSSSGTGVNALEVARARGSADFIIGEKRKPLEPGNTLSEGNIIDIGKGGEVFLKTESKTILYIAGPAKVELQRVRGGKEADFRFTIHHGSIAIKTQKSRNRRNPESEKVVWENRNTIYTMKGTMAQLLIKSNSRKLNVLTGAFEVSNSQNQTKYSVKKMESLNIDREGRVSVLGLSRIDLNRIRGLDRRMGQLAKGKMILEPNVRLNTNEEIRRYYGNLHRIVLHDGRLFIGFAKKQGSYYHVHTYWGTVKLQISNVKSIKILK